MAERSIDIGPTFSTFAWMQFVAMAFASPLLLIWVESMPE